MLRVLSLLMSMSVLLSGASVPQGRPRETPRVEAAEAGTEVEDHLQSLLEIDRIQERASRQTRQQVEQVKARLDKPLVHKPPLAPPSSKAEVALRFALSQVGKPYVWAADGPGSYDCSGLVMTAYAKVGIKLPHFTGTMIRFGKRVSRSQLQRGDIVFPTSGHVGIYLGNNTFVHASSSRGRVSVTKLYSFYAGRRI